MNHLLLVLEIKYLNSYIQSIFWWIIVWSDEEIKGKILHKLTRLGKFKASHTAIDNLPKGFPKDVRGRIKTLVKETS